MIRYGSLFKRKGSPYWQVYEIDDSARKGSRYKRISTKCRTKREAYRWIEDRKKIPEEVEPITFSEAVRGYLEVKQLKPRTLRDYRYVFELLGRDFGDREVHTISNADLERWLTKNRIRKPGNKETEVTWTPRNRNKYVSLLRTFFKWCVRQGYCTHNPARDIDMVREEKRSFRILTEGEEKKLLEACRSPFEVSCRGSRQGTAFQSEWKQKHTPPSYLYPIVLLALRTGLRYGNILKLRWDHIDWDNQMLRIKGKEMKSKRDWRLPISQDLLMVLRQLFEKNKRKKKPSLLVFPEVGNVRDSFKSVLRKNGLPDIRFHDLRGTFLTRVAPHTDPKTLQQIADHASIQTTLRYYVHTDEERVKEALKKAFGAGKE